MNEHSFEKADREAVYRAIFERRDMRHFIPGTIDSATLNRLFSAAHSAPSVGFMQPWRFIRITDAALRTDIHQLVEQERISTAGALGEREQEFMRLKVEGIRECSELIVASLMDQREPHIFGRRTMPEMDLASVACAIQNMWLAARAEGLGMGWVSLFDPKLLSDRLSMPEGSQPVAILCVGHVEQFYTEPMLAQQGWAARADISDYIMENTWCEPETSSSAD